MEEFPIPPSWVISIEEAEFLIWHFSRSEIWDALALLGLGKSSDGFTVKFYHFYWDIISDSLIQAFQSFHDVDFLSHE